MTTEQELFAAYKNPSGGYLSQCACGGWIEARHSFQVADAIRLHNLSREHDEWRCGQLAVEELRRPTKHTCPCHGGQEIAS